MIQVWELRIGNWIETPLGGDTVFEINCISEPYVNGWEIAEIIGIPLTSEWVLKLGFSRNENKFCIGEDEQYHVYEEDGEWVFTSDGYSFFFIRRIKYVHQLQNLVLEITGEELLLK